MKKITTIICVIVPIIIVILIGFGFRTMFLNRKIAALTETLNQKQAIVDSMISEIDMQDKQCNDDISFLNIMFDEIFTFYDIDDFMTAKQNAVDYGLSNAFVDNFYDTRELYQNAYAEQLLSVLCKFESADYYLLGRKDGTGFYAVPVKLSTVKNGGYVNIVLFLTINETGDLDERVSSIVYYIAS